MTPKAVETMHLLTQMQIGDRVRLTSRTIEFLLTIHPDDEWCHLPPEDILMLTGKVGEVRSIEYREVYLRSAPPESLNTVYVSAAIVEWPDAEVIWLPCSALEIADCNDY